MNVTFKKGKYYLRMRDDALGCRAGEINVLVGHEDEYYEANITLNREQLAQVRDAMTGWLEGK